MDGSIEGLLAQLKLEEKIKDGAENLLHEFDDRDSNKKVKGKTNVEHKRQVMFQLQAASSKIDLLKTRLRDMGYDDDDPSIHTPTPMSSASPSSVEPQVQFSTLFDSLDHRDDSTVCLAKVAAIAQVLESNPTLKNEFAISQMLEKLRGFFQSTDSLILSAGYHLCSLVTTSVGSIVTLRTALCLDSQIVRTLSKSDVSAELTERSQALNLIKTWMRIPHGIQEIAMSVVRALVAVSEQPSDKLKDTCLVILAEITLVHPQMAMDSRVIPVLLENMIDGSYDLAIPLAMLMVSLLDDPETRLLLRSGKDLVCVLTCLTQSLQDAEAPEPTTERLRATAGVICILLESWPGISTFNISTLIDCLLIPKRNVQDTVLDIFIWTLGGSPKTFASSGTGSTENVYRTQYTAFVLQKFLEKGLANQIYDLLQNSHVHEAVREKARLLSGYILRLASALFPQSFQAEFLKFPQAFSDEIEKAKAWQLPAVAGHIFQMDQALRAPARVEIPKVQYLYETPVQSYQQVLKLGQSSSVWIKMGSQMDEASFKNLIIKTNVLSTKTYSRWDWDTLLELIQGPLHNPRRLDEAIRGTKFLKRLISFYRPFKYRYSSTRNLPQNEKYTQVGSALIETLLDTPEGVRYLAGNKLLRQIAECLAQLDPTSGITSSEPLFKAQRLKSTLSSGYFEMLGVLSRCSQGQQIMSQLKIFNMFYSICDTDRSDVIELFISSMDYTLNGHPRLILAKALVIGSRMVRIFTTKFLQTLVKMSETDAQTEQEQTQEQQFWVIELLVAQLFDSDIGVVKMAIKSLEALCQNVDNLDHLISLKPSLYHLGSLGEPIYTMFLSRPLGYDCLMNYDFVLHEMDHWVHGYNEKYVYEVENYLQTHNVRWPHHDIDSDRLHPPKHFFGELVLTEQGCKLLIQGKYVSQFAQYIFEHSDMTEPEIVDKLKGYLWALGHIGSKPLGASLINMDIVQSICDIFLNSQIYSLRGTAFYVLGLIAHTFEGAEFLNQTGWSTTCNAFGNDVGIALISDMNKVQSAIEDFKAKRVNHISSPSCTNHTNDTFDFGGGVVVSAPTRRNSARRSLSSYMRRDSDENDVGAEIRKAISELSNHILANEASKKLVSLRAQHEEYFQSTEIYRDMLDMLERYRYKQLARRFLFEIFDSQNIQERLMRKRVHKTISRPA